MQKSDNEQLTFTVVIPTRNRPVDLIKAVESVFKQTRFPDEFMIIDQSPGDESKTIVLEMANKYPDVNLVYIHDTGIKGLVHAKKVASEKAQSEIVAFLEDDVELEVEYIEQMIKGFKLNPNMLGCSGIITNPFPQPKIYNFIFHMFHRGIFRDKRLEVYGKHCGWDLELVLSDKLSGGISAWKSEVFKEVQFDPSNDYFMLEDIDFSTRVAKIFGQRLFINPNARLEHHWSPVNRDLFATRQQKKMIESITFYKRRKAWSGAHLSMMWLLIGLFLEAIFKSVLTKSLSPMSHYFKGMFLGFKKA